MTTSSRRDRDDFGWWPPTDGLIACNLFPVQLFQNCCHFSEINIVTRGNKISSWDFHGGDTEREGRLRCRVRFFISRNTHVTSEWMSSFLTAHQHRRLYRRSSIELLFYHFLRVQNSIHSAVSDVEDEEQCDDCTTVPICFNELLTGLELPFLVLNLIMDYVCTVDISSLFSLRGVCRYQALCRQQKIHKLHLNEYDLRLLLQTDVWQAVSPSAFSRKHE